MVLISLGITLREATDQHTSHSAMDPSPKCNQTNVFSHTKACMHVSGGMYFSSSYLQPPNLNIRGIEKSREGSYIMGIVVFSISSRKPGLGFSSA